MEKQKIKMKPYIVSSIISLIVGAGIFCLYFFIRGKEVNYGIVIGSDASIIAAVCLISIGFLMFAGRQGFFDIFSYGFKQLGSQLFAKDANRFNNFPEYRDNKNTIRKSSPKTFLPVLIVGTAFLIAALVLFIFYKSALAQ